MPSIRAVRGPPFRINVEEQRVPNSLEVKLKTEVANDEFHKAIQMLSQVVFNQVGKQREVRHKVNDSLRSESSYG